MTPCGKIEGRRETRWMKVERRVDRIDPPLLGENWAGSTSSRLSTGFAPVAIFHASNRSAVGLDGGDGVGGGGAVRAGVRVFYLR